MITSVKSARLQSASKRSQTVLDSGLLKPKQRPAKNRRFELSIWRSFWQYHPSRSLPRSGSLVQQVRFSDTGRGASIELIHRRNPTHPADNPAT